MALRIIVGLMVACALAFAIAAPVVSAQETPTPPPTAAAATATPETETTLPRTGLRDETTSWRSPYLQTMVASFLAATVVLGLALRAGARRR